MDRKTLKEIICNTLPYYKSEDKDDYCYIVKKENVEELLDKLAGQGSGRFDALVIPPLLITDVAKAINKAYTDKGFEEYVCHEELHSYKLSLTVNEIKTIIEKYNSRAA